MPIQSSRTPSDSTMKVRQAIGNALQVQVAIHALDKSDCVHKLGGLTLLG